MADIEIINDGSDYPFTIEAQKDQELWANQNVPEWIDFTQFNEWQRTFFDQKTGALKFTTIDPAPEGFEQLTFVTDYKLIGYITKEQLKLLEKGTIKYIDKGIQTNVAFPDGDQENVSEEYIFATLKSSRA